MYCWDDPKSPKTTGCAAPPLPANATSTSDNGTASAVSTLPSQPCSFSYVWELTPGLTALDPASGPAGATNSSSLAVTGVRLGGVTSIALLDSAGGSWTCSVESSNDTAVMCSLPTSLPAGQYRVKASQADGGASVTQAATPGAAASVPLVYTAAARVAALLDNAGSVAGGSTLTLRAAADGGGFNSTLPSANTVLVGGRPCIVINASVSAGEIKCRVPGIAGLALVEYWQLATGTWTLPDLSDYTSPGERLRL